MDSINTIKEITITNVATPYEITLRILTTVLTSYFKSSL
jgi:hypothetical protein